MRVVFFFVLISQRIKTDVGKVSNIEVVDGMQSMVILSTFKESKVIPFHDRGGRRENIGANR